MTPEYNLTNRLFCYSFDTCELFSLPATDVPDKPVFLFDVYPAERLQELSKSHAIHAISFWSCEEDETLKSYLSGLLPQYFMVEYYKRWCRCTVVAEGTENIYVDVKRSWRSWELPGDVMVRVCYSGKIVRTQRSKVLPFDVSVCKV